MNPVLNWIIFVAHFTGDVVRIQPNHISFKSLKAVVDIHSTHTKARKGMFYDAVLRLPNLPANILHTRQSSILCVIAYN